MVRRSVLFGVSIVAVLLAVSCGPTQATCDGSNCTGCCNAAGTCVGGTALSACGTGGLACDVCVVSQGQACIAGKCGKPVATVVDLMTGTAKATFIDKYQGSVSAMLKPAGATAGTCQSAAGFAEEVWFLSVSAENGSPTGTDPVIKTGQPYLFNSPQQVSYQLSVNLQLVKMGANCGGTQSLLASAVSGSVNFSHIATDSVAATVTATLDDGRMVRGTFMAQGCPSLMVGTGCP